MTLSNIPDELLLELQEILELAGQPEFDIPSIRPKLTRLLNQNQSWALDLLLLTHPLLRGLPVEFIDMLGGEVQTYLRNENGPVVSNSDSEQELLDFFEEALLRASQSGRWQWLTVLTVVQSANSLDIFVRELLETEQIDQQQALMAFAPLMQRTDYDVDWLFPALFGGIHQAALAPVILDLANFCYRQQLCESHPAKSKESELLLLMDHLANRMSQMEDDPTTWSQKPEQISQMVSDSVALLVSLCDTMTLLESEAALPTLRKVANLRHRRIRAEAAFALAKLDNDSDASALIQLVNEPVSRLRVLKYADELGLSEQIDEKYRTPESLAESELALWLSQPSQMGVPPTQIELVDQRTQYWPSYDDPIDCFLFRFEYRMGGNCFANMAIVGPLTHTFLADLTVLEVEDVYAAFAGWQAEHEEIVQLDLASLSTHRQTDQFKLERRLHDFGAESIQMDIMGLFFGEIFGVFSCQSDGEATGAIVDNESVRLFDRSTERPLEPELLYSIYKGNKLIQAFNH